MADEIRKVVIEIRGSGAGGGGTPTGDDTGDTINIFENTVNIAMHPLKSLEAGLLGKSVFLNQAWQYAKTAIKSVASYEINKYFALNEDYLSENMLNNTLAGLSKLGGFASAVGSGAIGGATVGGPFGALAGGVIGAVGWGVSEAISSSQRLEKHQMTLQGQKSQYVYNLSRMGLDDGSRGTSN